MTTLVLSIFSLQNCLTNYYEKLHLPHQENEIVTGVTRLGHLVTSSCQVWHLDPSDLPRPVHATLALGVPVLHLALVLHLGLVSCLALVPHLA
jgi:hypothetical protein